MDGKVAYVSKEILFGRNSARWVSQHYDIPREELFVQWVFRNESGGFKAMIKRTGTETYYEVTRLSESPGYDIVVFEKKGEKHAS